MSRPGVAEVSADLLLMDKLFPLVYSDFRYAEFVHYLRSVPGSRVLTVWTNELVQPNLSYTFDECMSAFSREHPDLAGRVHLGSDLGGPVRAKLAYCMFLSNAEHFLGAFENHKIPFVFSLYPGGLFFNGGRSDEILRRVCGSPFFRGVITSQPLATSYVSKFAPSGTVNELWGIPVHPVHEAASFDRKRLHGVHKLSLDVCFVAYKYTPCGIDKGYDLFIRAAEKVAAKHRNAIFHVVGGFSPQDVNVSKLGGRIIFHQPMTPQALSEFFLGMDAIVAPNPDQWKSGGSFHGFPTGSSIGAGMSGVLVFASDPLGQNQGLVDGSDFVLVSPSAADIASKLDAFLQSPEDMYRVSRHAQGTFKARFGTEAQLVTRTWILQRILRDVDPSRSAPAPEPRAEADIRSASPEWKPYPFFNAVTCLKAGFHFVHVASPSAGGFPETAEMWRRAAEGCPWMSFLPSESVAGLQGHPMWDDARNFIILHEPGIRVPKARRAVVACRVGDRPGEPFDASLYDLLFYDTRSASKMFHSMHPRTAFIPVGMDPGVTGSPDWGSEKEYDLAVVDAPEGVAEDLRRSLDGRMVDISGMDGARRRSVMQRSRAVLDIPGPGDRGSPNRRIWEAASTSCAVISGSSDTWPAVPGMDYVLVPDGGILPKAVVVGMVEAASKRPDLSKVSKNLNARLSYYTPQRVMDNFFIPQSVAFLKRQCT